MSWAEVIKINSDLKIPLNATLDFIKNKFMVDTSEKMTPSDDVLATVLSTETSLPASVTAIGDSYTCPNDGVYQITYYAKCGTGNYAETYADKLQVYINGVLKTTGMHVGATAYTQHTIYIEAKTGDILTFKAYVSYIGYINSILVCGTVNTIKKERNLGTPHIKASNNFAGMCWSGFDYRSGSGVMGWITLGISAYSGNMTIYVDVSSPTGATGTLYAYVNGVVYKNAFTALSLIGGQTLHKLDIAVQSGDVIDIYTNAGGNSFYINSVRAYCDLVEDDRSIFIK